jgi:hypothetical protein
MDVQLSIIFIRSKQRAALRLRDAKKHPDNLLLRDPDQSQPMLHNHVKWHPTQYRYMLRRLFE